ncbi:Glu/Leu/Phe/Val dehydrogenase dimerization domain-containing protein [Streptomyces indonesiensis]
MMTPIHADGFEQVALCRDEETGLRSVVVIHDTTLGPALGGVRMHAYPDEDAAVVDGLWLAEAMTLKAAAAGLGLGGGWSIMIEAAELIVADTDPRRADAVAARHGARVVAPEAALAVACDVLAPCGLGSVVTDQTLPWLECRIIVGGANNVLATPAHAAMLQARGILYAPDFCVNAGDLIFLEEQLLGHDSAHAEARVRQVGVRVAEVLDRSRRTGVSTADAATELARARLRP